MSAIKLIASPLFTTSAFDKFRCVHDSAAVVLLMGRVAKNSRPLNATTTRGDGTAAFQDDSAAGRLLAELSWMPT